MANSKIEKAAGLSATASGEGFSVDYCERDILVAVEK